MGALPVVGTSSCLSSVSAYDISVEVMFSGLQESPGEPVHGIWAQTSTCVGTDQESLFIFGLGEPKLREDLPCSPDI